MNSYPFIIFSVSDVISLTISACVSQHDGLSSKTLIKLACVCFCWLIKEFDMKHHILHEFRTSTPDKFRFQSDLVSRKSYNFTLND